jgi:hypothetical protein
VRLGRAFEGAESEPFLPRGELNLVSFDVDATSERAFASCDLIRSARLGGLSAALSYVTFLRLAGGSLAASLCDFASLDVEIDVRSAGAFEVCFGRSSCEKIQLVNSHCSPYGHATSLNKAVVENTILEKSRAGSTGDY